MSTRTSLRPHSVITNGDMSQATITSEATVLQSISKFSYEVTWSGTSPVGTLKMQISNSYAIGPDGKVSVTGTWSDVPLDLGGSEVTSIPISGNSDSGFIDATVQAGYAVRLLYTKTSGTGTLNAIINGKVA